MNIRYQENLDGISPEMLAGFFVGWPNPPTPQTHLQILKNSDDVVLAVDDEAGCVVGFVNGITDHVLMSYLPLLEVLPEYQDQGIARNLMQRILGKYKDLYGIDLICDSKLIPFYEKFGMKAITGMTIRHYDKQAGRNT